MDRKRITANIVALLAVWMWGIGVLFGACLIKVDTIHFGDLATIPGWVAGLIVFGFSGSWFILAWAVANLLCRSMNQMKNTFVKNDR